MALWPQVHVVDHPVVQQKLAAARDKRTRPPEFRRLVAEISGLLVYESLREAAVEAVEVATPLGEAEGRIIAGEITLVPILRAGLVMAEGAASLIPEVRIGHLGIYRDETSLEPVVYYNKLPPDVAETAVIVLDPMLATGRSCSEALAAVASAGCQRITLVCVVATVQGIERVTRNHPDVPIYVAAMDEAMDRKGFIQPGLGDVADRLFGI
ncbi:MAG: uracil phosphoribosyltransferase [Phycisphaerae bacterium]|nr:uracil phosphoribosyltransferase [Phycisphaerae bacterium]